MELIYTTTKEIEKNYQITKIQNLSWIWWDSFENSKSKYNFHHISSNMQM